MNLLENELKRAIFVSMTLVVELWIWSIRIESIRPLEQSFASFTIRCIFWRSNRLDHEIQNFIRHFLSRKNEFLVYMYFLFPQIPTFAKRHISNPSLFLQFSYTAAL